MEEPENLNSRFANFMTSDRPVETISEDKLSRSEFANAISEAVASWKGRESLVIAVQGPWGSGKSSIKNFILENLRSHPKNPRILEFTPWEWPQMENVNSAFFKELSKVVRREDKAKNSKDIAENLQKYAIYLGILNVAESAKTFIPTAVVSLTILGVAGLANLADIKWLKYTSIGIGLFLALTTLAREVLNNLSTIFQKRSESDTQTAAEMHSELTENLRGIDFSIIVILDEIDRLNGKELISLLQLLKVNANFPNLVYLMFYDNQVIIKEIEPFIKSDPELYMQKMIQLSFPVPIMSQMELWNIIGASLDEIFSSPSAAKRYKSDEDLRVFYDLARYYFTDLRGAKRYLANLSFQVVLFDKTVFEVNPRDLMLLEVLRLFEPKIYSFVARSKKSFVGYVNEYEMKDNEDLVNGVIERDSSHPEYVREILQNQFPNRNLRKNDRFYGSNLPSTSYGEARICHPDIFSRYFQLQTSQEEISFSEIESVISTMDGLDEFLSILRNYEENGRLSYLLSALDNYGTSIPQGKGSVLVTGLFDLSDNIVDGVGVWFGPESSIRRIIYQYLKRLPSEVDRINILRELLNKTHGISMPIRIVYTLLGREENPPLFSNERLEEFKKQTVTMIRQRSASGRLTEVGHFLIVLYRWRDWGNEGEVKTWVSEQLKNRSTWLSLVRSFRTSTIRSTAESSITLVYLDYKAIEDFLPNMLAVKTWDELNIANPTEEENLLLDELKNPRNEL